MDSASISVVHSHLSKSISTSHLQLRSTSRARNQSPLVIGWETGIWTTYPAVYSIQTQQSPHPRTHAKHLAGDSLFNGARGPNLYPATTHEHQTSRWRQPI